MDRVRFGRALGYGARHAAKAISNAVAAAAAPQPSGGTAHPQAQIHQRATAVKAQSSHLKRSIFAPIKTFSSVVSLQVAGTFFAVFAATMGAAIWQRRHSFAHPGSPDARSLYAVVLLFALFAYFAISSFVRANRRQRR